MNRPYGPIRRLYPEEKQAADFFERRRGGAYAALANAESVEAHDDILWFWIEKLRDWASD